MVIHFLTQFGIGMRGLGVRDGLRKCSVTHQVVVDGFPLLLLRDELLADVVEVGQVVQPADLVPGRLRQPRGRVTKSTRTLMSSRTPKHCTDELARD